jgi:hypothetical protein
MKSLATKPAPIVLFGVSAFAFLFTNKFNITLSALNYQYYAKAVVTDLKILRAQKPSGETSVEEK